MADDIKIKVGVQSDVKSGMNNVGRDLKSSMSGISNVMGMLGVGLGLGSIVAGIKSIISSVGDLKDAADQVNFGTENYQKLAIVAEEGGVKADQLSAALGKVVKAQSEISTNKNAEQAFKDLGLSMEDVISANPEQLFEKIAKGFSETGDKAALFELFGRGAAKLIPTLREMADGFDSINREGIIKDSDIVKMDLLDEKIKGITRTLKGWGAGMVSGFIDFIDKASTMNAALLTGGDPRKALKDLKEGNAGSINEKLAQMEQAKRDKEESERIASEQKIADLKIAKANEVASELIDADAARAKAESERSSALFQEDLEREEELAKLRKSNQKKSIELDREAAQDEIKAVQRAAELQKEKDDERRSKLEKIMKDTAFGSRLIDDASTSQSWAAAKKKERQDITAWDRGVRQAQQAQDRFDRGVATDRDLALLGGLNAQAKAKAARDELVQMDKDAKQAAIATAKATRDLNDKLDILTKSISDIAKG